MDPQQIKAFIDAMAASDLDEMEVNHEGWTLRLVRRADNVLVRNEPVQMPSAPSANPDEVRAPMFGIVHLQQAPGDAPFVKVGDVIEAGQMLCTIEAMKVFNEVRAERVGRVSAVHVATGTEVEAGRVLITFESAQHV